MHVLMQACGVDFDHNANPITTGNQQERLDDSSMLHWNGSYCEKIKIEPY